MPLQTYKCGANPPHTFDRHVRIDLSDEPTRCIVLLDENDPKSECWSAVERQFPVPAKSFPGADSWRR